MYGDRHTPEFGAPHGTVPIGGKTIGVMGGLKLYGCPQTIPFAILQTTITDGEISMTLDQDQL